MIRKSLTVFFVLIANIILLAHAVIPHHAHQNKVCLERSHMHTNSSEHNNCTDPNHSSEQTDNCALNELVVVLSQQIRSELQCLDCPTTYSQFDRSQAQLLNEGVNYLFSQNVSSLRPPLLLFDYSSFVGNQIGLRGPPIV